MQAITVFSCFHSLLSEQQDLEVYSFGLPSMVRFRSPSSVASPALSCLVLSLLDETCDRT